MIGTRAWIGKTSGDLSGLDRARLLARIVGLRLQARLRSNHGNRPHSVELTIGLPDSKLVKFAEQECRECCSTAIYHHSCRTYYWAATLANVEAIDFDPEELAIASLLHDLELGKLQTRSKKGCRCFAGAGATAVDSWLRTHHVAKDRREAIAEAIALHLNPGVPLVLGATPHLLNIGAMADVVGTRMGLISAGARGHVLSSHPRHDFKQEMKRQMQAEQDNAPNSRAGFLMSIGFSKLIDDAPFDA
jgi:HD domain